MADDTSRKGVVKAYSTNDPINIGGKEPNGKPAAIGRWTFKTRIVREKVLDQLHGRVLNACCGETKLEKNGVDIVRNDLNPDIDADHHVDIEDIDSVFEPESFDVVLLDPPFDQGQAEEHYGNLHARNLGTARKKLVKLVRPGGSIIEFGWNTWGAADFFDEFDRVKEIRFKRAIPSRNPIFMTVDRRTQQTLISDGGTAQVGDIKQHLIDTGVGTDPALAPGEKETTWTAPKDKDVCTIFSEVPTVIKWILSVEESTIVDHRIYSDEDETNVVAVKAEIPKGIIKLQKSARKSNTHANMVSYGPLYDF